MLRPATAPELSDAELVARALGGDRRAEETIYRRHVRYIGGMVTRLLGRESEAEDAVQETFAIALERLSSLRDRSALRPWLAQIAVSRVRRRFRRARLLRALGLDRGSEDPHFESLASDTSPPEVRAELVALGAALRTLPTEQRIAWSLHHVEGETLAEAANACRCSLATIKRRIAAADVRIRDCVDLEALS